MVRCQMNFKRLSLTDIKIDIKRIPKKATLIKALEEAGNEPFLEPYSSNLDILFLVIIPPIMVLVRIMHIDITIG